MIRQGIRTRRLAWIGLGLVGMLGVLGLAAPAEAGDVFSATPLVTDATDGDLVNPWGISASASSPFWVSDNGTGLSTLYSVDPTTNATSKLGLVVSIPGDGSVSGQAFNTASASGAFNGDAFLFVSEDGTISGWRGALGTIAENLQLPLAGNIYKGVTLDTVGGHSYLLSANFGTGKIDVLRGDNGAPGLAGTFTDPGIPSGYAPFNISKLGSTIYVTYALQDGKDDLAGPGHGFVSAFDENGNFLTRIGTQGTLNSPWGLAIAPAGFGSLAGDLLVGNFGDGRINIFSPDLTSPAFLGQLVGPGGSPLTIDGLWGLIPGNGKSAGSPQDIYFTAGPRDESGGVLGVLQSVPEPGSIVLALIAIGTLTTARARRRATTGPRR